MVCFIIAEIIPCYPDKAGNVQNHWDDNKDEGSAALSSDEMVDTNNEDLASLTLNTNIEKCIYPGSSNSRAILFRVKSRQNNEEKDCFTMLGVCH